MAKPETRIDYSRRIGRVTDHIADNLDASLSVDTLAGIASFSPFHFHRIYRETTGETVTDTVRRLRLHRAAVDLIRDGTPLDRVAKRAGYGTLAAFSRAFSSDYGVPPGAYRLRGNLLPPPPKRPSETVVQYPVTIAPFAGVTLAAMKHSGDYHSVGNTFEKVFAWAAAHELMKANTRSIGIYPDDPDSIPEKDLRAEAGITVDEDFAAQPPVHLEKIPAMQCASVLHKGPYAELERAYRYLFRQWLPASGYDADDFPCFEEYLNNPRELPPTEWLTRIHLPVKG